MTRIHFSTIGSIGTIICIRAENGTRRRRLFSKLKQTSWNFMPGEWVSMKAAGERPYSTWAVDGEEYCFSWRRNLECAPKGSPCPPRSIVLLQRKLHVDICKIL